MCVSVYIYIILLYFFFLFRLYEESPFYCGTTSPPQASLISLHSNCHFFYFCYVVDNEQKKLMQNIKF